MDDPIDILGLTGTELAARAAERLTSGAGVAAAVYRQATREGRFAPEEFGLHPRSVAAWRAAFRLSLPDAIESMAEPSEHGMDTVKSVLCGADEGRTYECVRIPMGRGAQSLCISSQVGCRMACRFCETARMGLRDHLSAAEIVGQVVWARRHGPAPRSIVFMGMGEPLDNASEVVTALRILNDPGGLAMAQEHLTVCTVGHVPGIHALRALGFKRLNLSLSLNAPDDELRAKLMPVAAAWPLAEVQAALVAYRQRSNFQLGVNYCLMPGINAGREHARGIRDFVAPLGRAMVNLIPYNPGSVPLCDAPTEADVVRFVGWLREEGLSVRRRITKGRSIMAACGQLRPAGERSGARD